MEYFIYGLRATGTGEIIYVGSTTDLKRREYEHRYNTETESRESSYLIYSIIREIGGWTSVEMELLGIFDDENRFQTEREFVDYLKPIGNNYRPKVSPEERQKQKDEWFLNHPNYRKEFYLANREKIIQNVRKNQLDNLERTRQQQKKWREDNREKMAKYMRAYRQRKKEAEATEATTTEEES